MSINSRITLLMSGMVALFLTGMLFGLSLNEKLPPTCPKCNSLESRFDALEALMESNNLLLDKSVQSLNEVSTTTKELSSRKPLVVEKVVEIVVEKQLPGKTVEKVITKEVLIHKNSPSAIDAMKYAKRYVAQWTFTDDVIENKIRAEVLSKLVKALSE